MEKRHNRLLLFAILNVMSLFNWNLSTARTQVICGVEIPQGWVSIAVNGYCTKGSTTTYISKTITRIDGLAAGTDLEICGSNIPAG